MLDETFFTVVVVLLIISIKSQLIQGENCRFSIEYKTGDLKEPSPLILSNGERGLTFLYPNDKAGYINVHPFEEISLACPGKTNYIEGIDGVLNKPREIQVTCMQDKLFRVINIDDGGNQILFNITSVVCKRLPENEARSTSEQCFDNAKYIELGFRLDNDFVRTINVCYDNINHSTYYAHHILTDEIEYRQSSYPRPGKWYTGQFYTKYDMEYLYKMTTQYETVVKTVGSEELASKYVQPGTVRYMARGHLAPKGDFVYGNEQRSTFWYMNAAPQWQSFNGGNWNTLEDNVRTFASTRLLNLEVYTGVYGQMKLIDVNDNSVPLYLSFNDTDKSLPVPLYFWKIIYDRERLLGTAFIGVNDPYVSESSDEIYICDDISSKINWLTWDADKINKGISYACTIDDISNAIPSIPKLNVDDILI